MNIIDITQPGEIAKLAQALKQNQDKPLSYSQLIGLMDQWRCLIEKDRAVMSLPGAPFLTMWLRRAHLEDVVRRELGPEALTDQWQEQGKVRIRHLPVGIVAHWPATNVEVQPLLTAFCGLLSQNQSIVRISPSLKSVLTPLIDSLYSHESLAPLAQRVKFICFASDQQALNNEMAQHCDGAMIWGGKEAIAQLRALDFPAWAKVQCYGPRVSAAVVHSSAYSLQQNVSKLANRVAREVWQFEQMACSSPQMLFIEQSDINAQTRFKKALVEAFEREAALHPRTDLAPHFTSSIVQARAQWLTRSTEHKATFPSTPDWTLLECENQYAMPDITGHKVLHLSWVDSLDKCIEQFDGHVQTLGLAANDSIQEIRLADLAVCRGVDRVVPIGKMHLFDSPWDGMPLVSSLMRTVRHTLCHSNYEDKNGE
jgi:hypothetical protein